MSEPISNCGPHGQSALLKAIRDELVTLNAAIVVVNAALVTAQATLETIEANTGA